MGAPVLPAGNQRFWTIGRVIIVGFGVLIAGISYFILSLDYRADDLASPENIEYPYHLALVKKDLADPARAFDVKVTMMSSTFSAQSLIGFSTQISQINGTRPPQLYFLFPRANEYYGDNTSEFNEDFRGVVLNLTYQVRPEYVNTEFDVPFYEGTYQGLRYEIGGCYNFIVTSSYETAKQSQSLYDSSECSEIQVASLEVTSAAETNKVNIQIAKSSLEQTEIGLRITWILLLLTIYGTMFTAYEVAFRKTTDT